VFSSWRGPARFFFSLVVISVRVSLLADLACASPSVNEVPRLPAPQKGLPVLWEDDGLSSSRCFFSERDPGARIVFLAFFKGLLLLVRGKCRAGEDRCFAYI